MIKERKIFEFIHLIQIYFNVLIPFSKRIELYKICNINSNKLIIPMSKYTFSFKNKSCLNDLNKFKSKYNVKISSKGENFLFKFNDVESVLTLLKLEKGSNEC